ncbi:MAG: hypothetical protein K2Z81_12810, partial [Cyanobacteria bacterium]|nr:hypothetical protein [Cyanobacteriota bacterium]
MSAGNDLEYSAAQSSQSEVWTPPDSATQVTALDDIRAQTFGPRPSGSEREGDTGNQPGLKQNDASASESDAPSTGIEADASSGIGSYKLPDISVGNDTASGDTSGDLDFEPADTSIADPQDSNSTADYLDFSDNISDSNALPADIRALFFPESPGENDKKAGAQYAQAADAESDGDELTDDADGDGDGADELSDGDEDVETKEDSTDAAANEDQVEDDSIDAVANEDEDQVDEGSIEAAANEDEDQVDEGSIEAAANEGEDQVEDDTTDVVANEDEVEDDTTDVV